MYQGGSDRFIGPTDDIEAADELGHRLRGAIGVYVDDVPMGTTAQDARKHIKLVTI